MARRSSTSTSNARSGTADSESDNTGEPSTDISSESSIVAGDAVPPVKRRKRGPNKTKPGTFAVRTEAVLTQTEIRKLLVAHATVMLGTDVAAKMTLQVNIDGKWLPLLDLTPSSVSIQFATVIDE